MRIRQEQSEDHTAVHRLNTAAFETAAEANLVDSLRRQAEPYISLVAEDDGNIAGHILFTPVTLSGHPELNLMGLAPMAVLPEKQRQGIGGLLVQAGVEQCRALQSAAVAVLGHPSYYPKFGFQPSVNFNIRSEYEVPDEVFMLLPLQPEQLANKSGMIKYHNAFNEL